MKVIAMIPARFEASRFPGKLMKLLGGIPVIRYTFNAVRATGLFDGVYVVTDSDAIYDEITKHGGQAIMSLEDHQSGSDRIAEAVQTLDADVVINVQGDEPFVNANALGGLIEALREDQGNDIDVASLMVSIDDKTEIENPNNVKVVTDEQGFAMYFSRAAIPYPREAGETIYFRHIGVYAFRRDSLLRFTKLKMNKLERVEKLENLRFLANGMRVKMLETDSVSFGIDTPEDLVKANAFLDDRGY